MDGLGTPLAVGGLKWEHLLSGRLLILWAWHSLGGWHQHWVRNSYSSCKTQEMLNSQRLSPQLRENSKYRQLEKILQAIHILITCFIRHPLAALLAASLTTPSPQLSEALHGLCREDQGACWGQGTEYLYEDILWEVQPTWGVAASHQWLVCRGKWNEIHTYIKAELAWQANLQRELPVIWNNKTSIVCKAADGKEHVSPQLAFGFIYQPHVSSVNQIFFQEQWGGLDGI